MSPMLDYDNAAAKMAGDDVIRDDDVMRGEFPGVSDCRCQGRARGDGRRRRAPGGDVRSGRPLTRPDGTACRRVATTRTIGQTSTETTSTADRTLLAGADPHSQLNVRLTDAIWQSDAVANSILGCPVAAAVVVVRPQYARSRRRRRRRPSVAAASVAASLLAAALLVGSVAADPRRFHGESSHAAAALSRQLAPSEPGDGRGAPRRPQSDNIGAGIPCIYEGHIKTDR